MGLTVNDDEIEKPSADDIVRALSAPSFPEDWYIILERDDGALIDAEWQGGGTFTLGNIDKTRKRHAVPNVNVETLKAVLLKFFHGAPDWDVALHWEADTPVKAPPSSKGPMKFVPAKSNTLAKTLTGQKGGEPPTWAIVGVVASIALIFIVVTLADWFPGLFPNSTIFYVSLIFLPIVVMLALMIGNKMWELKKARSWSQTTGRIVKSTIETQRHRFQGEAETVKNVPAVEYEFSVGNTKVRGSRIAIGDDSGGANTEATLARYPVGRDIMVYYDPDDPTQCVLERGGPQLATAAATSDAGSPNASASQSAAKDVSKKGCAGGLIGLAAVGFIIYWMVVDGPAYLAAHFPNAPGDPRFVLAAAGFGLLALLFFFAFRSASKKAQSWPSVRGKIVKSVVETFSETSDGRTRTSHRAAVEFVYAVHGREYHGNQVKLMVQTSGSKVFAEKVCAKYPQGSGVDVYYDPANPGTAALENPTGMSWLVLAVAVACFALAAWQLGIFR